MHSLSLEAWTHVVYSVELPSPIQIGESRRLHLSRHWMMMRWKGWDIACMVHHVDWDVSCKATHSDIYEEDDDNSIRVLKKLVHRRSLLRSVPCHRRHCDLCHMGVVVISTTSSLHAWPSAPCVHVRCWLRLLRFHSTSLLLTCQCTAGFCKSYCVNSVVEKTTQGKKRWCVLSKVILYTFF